MITVEASALEGMVKGIAKRDAYISPNFHYKVTIFFAPKQMSFLRLSQTFMDILMA